MPLPVENPADDHVQASARRPQVSQSLGVPCAAGSWNAWQSCTKPDRRSSRGPDRP